MKKRKIAIYLSTISILWVLVMGFTVYTFAKPTNIVEKKTNNVISQDTTITYDLEVNKSTLYPNGGIVKPKSGIMANLTKAIHLHINSAVNAKNDIKVKGKQKVYIRLIAENLWEQDFALGNEVPISSNGTNISILNNDYTIVPSNFINYINNIEKEVNTRPNRYIMAIEPSISGEINANGRILPLGNAPVLYFQINNNVLNQIDDPSKSLSSDNNITPGIKKSTKVIPIESTVVIPQYIDMFNKKVPVNTARYIFVVLLIIISLPIIREIITYRVNKLSKLKESDIIDRKYGKRLIFTDGVINMSNMMTMASFNSLIKISDEKESPVFRCENVDGDIRYCVIDSNVVYTYYPNRQIDFIKETGEVV